MKVATAIVPAAALLCSLLLVVDADTAPAASKTVTRRGTSNVEFQPSISRSLPSTRYQFPSHYFDRNTPALITRHRPGPRRLAHGKPPPYAVQMEPLVQYSQRDPLYQEATFNGHDIDKKYNAGPGPAYTHNHHHHPSSHHQQQPKYVILKEPEPIIEIIVQDSNDTLPTQTSIQLPLSGNRPREPVQVFYVKYRKDEHSDGVIYEKPVAAVTPTAPLDTIEEEHPAPAYGPPADQGTTPAPAPSTTLRTVIHPDSEKIHVSTGGLKITFGNKEQEHTYKTKRQQPHIGGPSPRFNTADFPPQFSNPQPQFSHHNRFLAPPPSVQNSRNSPPQFFPSFPRANQFQQPSPVSFGGKLEPVPFKQPSTGKIEFFDGNTYSSFPHSQPQFRYQEPVNGLPPPPPPFSFQRPSFQSQPPSFNGPSGPSFRNARPQQQNRPFPQSFSQPQFSQPLPSPPASAFPSRLPQPAPFSPLPPSVAAPQFPQHAPQIPFKPLPTQFSLPATTTTQPPPPPPSFATQASHAPATPTTQPQQQQFSFGSEIVKSLSPSTEELRKQQQEQFRREQEYFLEIQKYQKELELRAKESATAKPTASALPTTTAKKTTNRQQQVNYSYPSTTPAPATSAAPAGVPSNVVLPDEVPDDLREQLLSSGILSNADIQILDYDKVGDIPVGDLPPEALSQFLGATKGGAGAGSAPVPQFVPAPSHRKSDDGDSIAEPSDIGSNKIPGPVELKVVRYEPGAEEDVSNKYVQSGATTLDPVELNDRRYNRYLPLQVAGSSFPIPNAKILEGRNITSVVVLAPVVQQVQGFARRSGHVVETEESVEFVAGETLTELVQKPSKNNFNKFIEKERKTPTNKQAVILLVAEKDQPEKDEKKKEIFMFDVNTQQVNKLKGELSSTFVDVALANSNNQEAPAPANLSNKIETTTTTTEAAPAKKVEKVSISSGYSRTKQ